MDETFYEHRLCVGVYGTSNCHFATLAKPPQIRRVVSSVLVNCNASCNVNLSFCGTLFGTARRAFSNVLSSRRAYTARECIKQRVDVLCNVKSKSKHVMTACAHKHTIVYIVQTCTVAIMFHVDTRPNLQLKVKFTFTSIMSIWNDSS